MMHNPWSSYVMASEGSEEWEVTSPMVPQGGRVSYLDKVRGGDRDGGGRGGTVHDNTNMHTSVASLSASSSTTPYPTAERLEENQGERGKGAVKASRVPEGYIDAYVLEGMVADTTVGIREDRKDHADHHDDDIGDDHDDDIGEEKGGEGLHQNKVGDGVDVSHR